MFFDIIDNAISSLFYVYILPFTYITNEWYPAGINSITNVSGGYIIGMSMLSVYFVYLIALPMFFITIFLDDQVDTWLFYRLLFSLLVPFFVPFLMIAFSNLIDFL